MAGFAADASAGVEDMIRRTRCRHLGYPLRAKILNRKFTRQKPRMFRRITQAAHNHTVGGQDGTAGGIAYGGLGYEVSGDDQVLKVWDASVGGVTEFTCPFVPDNPLATFNRLSLKSTVNGVTKSTT